MAAPQLQASGGPLTRAGRELVAISAVGFIGVLVFGVRMGLPSSQAVWLIKVCFAGAGLLGVAATTSDSAPSRTRRALLTGAVMCGWLLVVAAAGLIVVVEIETHSRS